MMKILKKHELCTKSHHEDYVIEDGFIFRGTQLCIPKCSLREHIIQELYYGGLGGHFGRDQIILLVKSKYFWSTIYRDVACHVKR